MVIFSLWSGQNPPFEHHKNEATEKKGTESTRAKHFTTLRTISLNMALQRENYVTTLSGGKE